MSPSVRPNPRGLGLEARHTVFIKYNSGMQGVGVRCGCTCTLIETRNFLPENCCSGFISSARSAWSSTVLVPVFSPGLGSAGQEAGVDLVRCRHCRPRNSQQFLPPVRRKNKRGMGSELEMTSLSSLLSLSSSIVMMLGAPCF